MRGKVRLLFILGKGRLLFERGVGVGVEDASGGRRLAGGKGGLVRGHWGQLAAARMFMAVVVTTFSLMADAGRDALDPKLRGLE